jgi:hypothetical protein
MRKKFFLICEIYGSIFLSTDYADYKDYFKFEFKNLPLIIVTKNEDGDL